MNKEIPSALIDSLLPAEGFSKDTFEKVHTSGAQVTSIRLNPFKPTTKISHQIAESVPWSSDGFYLNARPSFTLDPSFHGGAYYVQEASSMFLEHALRQSADISKEIRVLDLCAAPGGKSTLIQSVISDESLLVSNEIIKSRVNILSENISKWGSGNVIVTNNDAKDFQRLPHFFDVIVVDAPCSGSGLFRKDPAAIDEWSLENVYMCSVRQKKILADCMSALKPGGVLIYSTCSYSVEEDEDIADWLVENYQLENIRLSIPAEWNIIKSNSKRNTAEGYRFYPDKLKGEGFFISVFRKPDEDHSTAKELKSRFKILPSKDENLIRPYLNLPETVTFVEWQDEVLALPANSLHDIALLQSALYIKKAGFKIGALKHGELIPHHELALSSNLSTSTASMEVDLSTALEYLRKRDVIIDVNRKGWMVLKFNGIALGWIKNLGSRINNYYPKEWRILNM